MTVEFETFVKTIVEKDVSKNLDKRCRKARRARAAREARKDKESSAPFSDDDDDKPKLIDEQGHGQEQGMKENFMANADPETFLDFDGIDFERMSQGNAIVKFCN